MNDIRIVKYNDTPVVTTKQLAEAYGTDSKQVSQGFNRNKRKFTEGKHFFILAGEELKAFRLKADLPSNVGKMYLWTNRGALLMAKIIDTDIAWDAYERLVDFYFEKKEEPAQLSASQQPIIPIKSSTPVPLVSDWYSKKKSKIWEICNARNVRPKTLYHHILMRIGEIYDISAARAIYEKEKGYPPMNAIDIVGYFPELEEMADEYMDKLLND